MIFLISLLWSSEHFLNFINTIFIIKGVQLQIFQCEKKKMKLRQLRFLRVNIKVRTYFIFTKQGRAKKTRQKANVHSKCGLNVMPNMLESFVTIV